jgi:hypothetical protein
MDFRTVLLIVSFHVHDFLHGSIPPSRLFLLDWTAFIPLTSMSPNSPLIVSVVLHISQSSPVLFL